MKITQSEFDSTEIAYQLLVERFDYNLGKGITFVDVGAGQPEFYSNSYKFRSLPENKIISIDANPNNCKMFEDLGYEILQYGVVKDDTLGEMTFREFPHNIYGLSWSSLAYHNEGPSDYYQIEYQVPTLSLTSILKKHYPETNSIDILDIDTEGNELDVMDGLDFEFYNPKILIIENTNPDPTIYHRYYEKIGYEIVAKAAHNDILIKKSI